MHDEEKFNEGMKQFGRRVTPPNAPKVFPMSLATAREIVRKHFDISGLPGINEGHPLVPVVEGLAKAIMQASEEAFQAGLAVANTTRAYMEMAEPAPVDNSGKISALEKDLISLRDALKRAQDNAEKHNRRCINLSLINSVLREAIETICDDID